MFLAKFRINFPERPTDSGLHVGGTFTQLRYGFLVFPASFPLSGQLRNRVSFTISQFADGKLMKLVEVIQ